MHQAQALCPSSASARGPLCPSSPNASSVNAHHPRQWRSPDPRLAALEVNLLQLGGDTWNRCGRGWLNIDGNFDDGDVAGLVANVPKTDPSGRHVMRHELSDRSRLPFADASVLLIYSEHMLEHLRPAAGLNFLRESWRVLAPGGVLRLVTPDLSKYACALANGDADGFLRRHAARFPPMDAFGKPPSAATMLNNIMRNYGHEWVYSPDELVRAAARAGIPSGSGCVSDRFDPKGPGARGLPAWAQAVMRRANAPRNSELTCWLDQEVRSDESFYFNFVKP